MAQLIEQKLNPALQPFGRSRASKEQTRTTPTAVTVLATRTRLKWIVRHVERWYGHVASLSAYK